MCPHDVAPNRTLGVILVEEMVKTFVVYWTCFQKTQVRSSKNIIENYTNVFSDKLTIWICCDCQECHMKTHKTKENEVRLC